MARLELPEPVSGGVLPFRDVQSARAWLKVQPQTEPLQMQTQLLAVIQALDAADLAVAVRIGILEALRGAVILAQSGSETRYTRKPVPLPPAEAKVFATARQLWRALAVAYLRTVLLLPPSESLVSLHRGVMALRLEQYAHFLAAYEVPGELLRLLNGVLATAESLGIQRTPLSDPEYKHLGESHIAGHVAWAFLLQFIDPYRLSAAQLVVANRAFSRWRELAGFQTAPEDDPKARALSLQAILGEQGVVEGGPGWLDVRPVARKIRKRLEALEAGETPESLKLGRELSTPACIRLLQQIDEALRPGKAMDGCAGGNVQLVFGAEKCYAVLAGEELNPAPVTVDPGSRAISQQRMAVFGFDNLVTNTDAAKRVDVPAETWQMAGGSLWRSADAGVRLLAPCLVASPAIAGEPARLGVLNSLQVTADGKLRARLLWYPQRLETAWFKVETAGAKGQKVPAFVLGGDDGLTVVLPAAAGARLGSRLFLEDADIRLVALGAVLERGSDFVRYAVDQQ